MITTPYTNVSKNFYRMYKHASAPFRREGTNKYRVFDNAYAESVWKAFYWLQDLKNRRFEKAIGI